MLQRIYNGLNQEIFTISKKPDPIVYIEDLEVYNQQEGLALSQEEIAYLNEVSQKLGRKLTDSEGVRFLPSKARNTADIKYSEVYSSSTARKKKVPCST